MTKSEFRTLIREALQEELKKDTLTEAVVGPTYVIKAWEKPELRKGIPTFDSAKKGKRYPEFEDVLRALKAPELDGMGVYEITWVQTGEQAK